MAAAAPEKALPAGWDVGERPTVHMAYLEYPEYVPSLACCHRDEGSAQTIQPVAAAKTQATSRQEMRNVSGWSSDTRKVYKPLGRLEDLPQTGPELRRKKVRFGSLTSIGSCSRRTRCATNTDGFTFNAGHGL